MKQGTSGNISISSTAEGISITTDSGWNGSWVEVSKPLSLNSGMEAKMILKELKEGDTLGIFISDRQASSYIMEGSGIYLMLKREGNFLKTTLLSIMNSEIRSGNGVPGDADYEPSSMRALNPVIDFPGTSSDTDIPLHLKLEYDNAWIISLNGVKTYISTDNNSTDNYSADHYPRTLLGDSSYIRFQSQDNGPSSKTIVVQTAGSYQFCENGSMKDFNAPLMVQNDSGASLPPVMQFTPTAYEAQGVGSGTDYYFSYSVGNNANSGTSDAAPFRDFSVLMDGTVTLSPGDRIRLKRGDSWTGVPSGRNAILNVPPGTSGTATQALTITDYGSHPDAPKLIPNDRYYGFGIKLHSPEYWLIENIHVDTAKLGIFLYAASEGGPASFDPVKNIEIRNCSFNEIAMNNPSHYTDFSTWDGKLGTASKGESPNRTYGTFWNVGIFLGSDKDGFFNPGVGDPLLFENINIHGCSFTNSDTGFGNAVYYFASSTPIAQNFVLKNCIADGVLQGGFMLNNLRGALVENFDTVSGGGYADSGVCGGFLQYCYDISIRDSSFNNVVRKEPGYHTHDGVGLDLEGACQRILIENCEFKNNAGAGLMLCATDPAVNFGFDPTPNADILVRNSLFDSNCKDPDSLDKPERLGMSDFDILNWQSTAEMRLYNNTIISSGSSAPYSPICATTVSQTGNSITRN
ncbi:MAG: right-handed parallel beta-helix repeat-containing protein [Spirochaetales bacterium]|nr:right-handed parallel beta-helix repeat-containing protein [Spirochaetales bacterium]